MGQFDRPRFDSIFGSFEPFADASGNPDMSSDSALSTYNAG
jgi:hypothetical protein